MTEEIIIDGVDVSGCNFRLERDNKQKCECCHATGFGVICDCEAWHNCYYKQLKRLEQENKELKELIGKTRYNRLEMYESFKTECNNYRSALEEIRDYLNTLSSIDSDFPNTETYLRIQDAINEVLNA